MSTLKRLLPYAQGRRAMLPMSLALSAASACLGMAPLVLIWQIVRELLAPSSKNPSDLVQTCAWWALGTALASVVAYFLALSLSHLAAFRVEANMRRKCIHRIMTMPLGFFDHQTSGKIRKIIDENASITHSFLAHQLPDLARTMVVPFSALVLIFVFDWRLGLATLVPIVLAITIMGTMIGKRGAYFMKTYMSSLEEMNTEAVEYVRGIPVVKVFQQTVFSFKRFHDSILRYKEMVFRYTMLWEKPMTTYTVIIHGFAYLLIPLGILLITYGSAMAPMLVDLFFYILLTPLFAQSIMKSMYLSQALGQAHEAVDRVDRLLNVSSLPVAETPKPITGHDIEFQHVSFRYDGSERKAVNDISFTVPAGRTYALVGPSGSGKTTLARLVPRFWDTESGQVLIGGTNVRDLDPAELMANVSFVFQNNRLFKTTLLENIQFGNPQASREQIEKAIDLAQCRDIIDRLPDGLDTRIGADGTYLSGGEQQRIALARAFVKDAPIVILDEATAFADPENEHLIQRALAKLMKGKTVLMIAHRLSSVTHVDRIIVIDKGAVVEQGVHSELVERDGLYADMWRQYQQAVQWTLRGNAAAQAVSGDQTNERNVPQPEVQYA